MGLIGQLLSFIRTTRNGANVSDVKTDPGGGANVTAEHFAAPGVDSHPLPGDYVCAVPVPQSGRKAAVGYVDPVATPKAEAGETRLYARQSDGTPVAEVWTKNTGEVTTANDNGSVTLAPDGSATTTSPQATFTVAADGSISGSNSAGGFQLTAGGDFVVNGVTISAAGGITAPSTIQGAGITDTLTNVGVGTHNHGGAAPVPGT